MRRGIYKEAERALLILIWTIKRGLFHEGALNGLISMKMTWISLHSLPIATQVEHEDVRALVWITIIEKHQSRKYFLEGWQMAVSRVGGA